MSFLKIGKGDMVSLSQTGTASSNEENELRSGGEAGLASLNSLESSSSSNSYHMSNHCGSQKPILSKSSPMRFGNIVCLTSVLH